MQNQDVFIPAAIAAKYKRESLIDMIKSAYLTSDLGEEGFNKQNLWLTQDWQTESVTELLFEVSEKIHELEISYPLDWEFSKIKLEFNSWIITRLED